MKINMARRGSWRGWILVPIGLLAVAITWTWLGTSVTGQVLHPSPQAIPSATHTKPSPQSAKWSPAVDRARRIVRAEVAGRNLPGLSVAVGVAGEIVWTEGFGWADIETRAPVTPQTRFRIGTASTVLTSAAVGMLLDNGRLSLDGEIQTHVPQFPKKPWPVTLRQLMAHVGGLATDGGNEAPLLRQRCERPVEALRHFAGGALLYEPGTRYLPSKYGWILVSAAVEAAANQPFLTFMKERIFHPLGMNDTGAESATEENPERVGEPEEDPPFATFIRQVILKPLGIGGTTAKPATDPATVYVPGSRYNPRVRHGFEVMRLQNLSCYAGSMAFFSTPSDLVRFGLAIDGGKLLRPATVRLLQSSQQLASGKETGHGLGWDLDPATPAMLGKPVGHDGELMGRTVMSLMMFREAGIVVAVMSNTSDADAPALALKVAAAFAPPGTR